MRTRSPARLRSAEMTRSCCSSAITFTSRTPDKAARSSSWPSRARKIVPSPPSRVTHESKLPYYGAVGGKLVDAARHLYQVDTVLEKPTPTEAEQQITVPGLRAGYYLCFFGMHVLTPSVHRFLAELLKKAEGRENAIHLRAALAQLAEHERYLAVELAGRRYDFGVKYGLLTAQLALALEGRDRDEVLRGIVELLATGRPPAK